MNDPERLLSGSATATELTLLRSAEVDEPPADGAAKLATLLGVCVTLTSVPAAASVAATASQAPAAGAVGTIAKWKLVVGKLALKHLAVGAGGLALAGTVALSALPRAPSTPARAPHEAVAPRHRSEAFPPPAPSAPEPASAADDADAGDTPSASKSAPVPSIAGEISALDAVRAALVAGAPSRAISLLEAYERSYKGGALREEAWILRIDALSQAQRTDEARRATRRFLKAYPRSVHVGRLRAGLRGPHAD
jgi:hypothetical protein